MKTEATFTGKQKVLYALEERIRRATKRFEGSMVVGYSAPYALAVHEDLERWHPSGQAKFLEEPIRKYTNDGTIQGMIKEKTMHGVPMTETFQEVGKFIISVSQLLVPVQTGFLRDSAFVRVEEK